MQHVNDLHVLHVEFIFHCDVVHMHMIIIQVAHYNCTLLAILKYLLDRFFPADLAMPQAVMVSFILPLIYVHIDDIAHRHQM